MGSREVAEKVLGMLETAGIKAKGVERGLDHGVWASFKCGKFIPPSHSVLYPTPNKV